MSIRLNILTQERSVINHAQYESPNYHSPQNCIKYQHEQTINSHLLHALLSFILIIVSSSAQQMGMALYLTLTSLTLTVTKYTLISRHFNTIFFLLENTENIKFFNSVFFPFTQMWFPVNCRPPKGRELYRSRIFFLPSVISFLKFWKLRPFLRLNRLKKKWEEEKEREIKKW